MFNNNKRLLSYVFIIYKRLLNVNGAEQKNFARWLPRGQMAQKIGPRRAKVWEPGAGNWGKRLFKRTSFRYNGKSEGNTAQFQVVERAGKFFVR